MLFRYLIMTTLACCLAGRGMAQAYNGIHKYDGEHPNVLTSYLTVGDNILCDHFYGLEASYTRHLTDRWHVATCRCRWANSSIQWMCKAATDCP